MGTALEKITKKDGATIFAYEVANPSAFGVVEFDESGNVVSLEEKPKNPRSNYIVPGLYFYDSNVSQIAKSLKPSPRGELEITDLHSWYLDRGMLQVEILDDEKTWFDTGTIDDMHRAASIVFDIEKKIGKKINVPEEIAWRLGYISDQELVEQANKYPSSGYGDYLLRLLD
jgi:glucose-1-phosphate thymidylyltransferase